MLLCTPTPPLASPQHYGARPAASRRPRRHPPGGRDRTGRHRHATAARHLLPLPRRRPRHVTEVQHDGDLVVTVCDLAYEELGDLVAVHWSVPDPVPVGDPGSFDAALAELVHRVERFAPCLAAS